MKETKENAKEERERQKKEDEKKGRREWWPVSPAPEIL